MDAGYAESPVPGGKRASLGRPAPHVAHCEDARTRGFDLARLAAGWPARIGCDGSARQQEAVLVLGEAIVQPFRVRLGADEAEEPCAVEAPPVPGPRVAHLN